ncbi:hypothetical protein PIROE2DRAFT_64854 [Piromyces sp. E2]|nr:hypothetical protein PIROE2DRAFT_64854 [Piromyces sp. E2]|eukprot:OUM57703.1 hypothetical protein PIROE2DRAFT_64854 [Piromyces sp. E2]
MVSEKGLPSYSEIENKPTYLSAPHDETHKKFKRFSSEIFPPDHEIVVTDSEYLNTRHTVFTVREGFSKYSGNTIVILDNENKEVFNCHKKWFSNTTCIYDCSKMPVVSIHAGLSFKDIPYSYRSMKEISERLDISSGKSKDGRYGRVEAKWCEDEETVYIAKYDNIFSKKREMLRIMSYGRSNYFVYSNGKRNETLICKFQFYTGKHMVIEVAPRVDYMYMISLCLGIHNLNALKSKNYC